MLSVCGRAIAEINRSTNLCIIVQLNQVPAKYDALAHSAKFEREPWRDAKLNMMTWSGRQ